MIAAEEEARHELGERPAPAAFVAAADVQALQASIERLVAVNRSINNRLAWIVGLVTLILIRVLLRG